MQVLVALVCLLPSFNIWAANGQHESQIDLLGDPDRYNDKRQNYGVCCNGRRRAGKRNFNANSRLLHLLELALIEPPRPKQEPAILGSPEGLRASQCCKQSNSRLGPMIDPNTAQLQKEILWKALTSPDAMNNQDSVVKRDPDPIGVSFGG